MRRAGGTLALALGVAALLAALGGSGTSEAQRIVPQKDAKLWRVKFADSLVSINDRCAVKENQLNIAVRPVYVNGKPVAFCCTTCPPIFVQGPEPYLQRMKATFQDPVEPKLPAHVAAGLRYTVNWEIF